MRRVEVLIKQARHRTDHEDDQDGVTGISDREMVQSLNDAQARAMGILQDNDSEILNEAHELAVSRGQASYPIPDETYLTARVVLVEYSPTGREENYYPLHKRELRSRNTCEGIPTGYIRSGQSLILTPVPGSNGTLRVTRQKTIPALDKRRGKVAEAVLDTEKRTITTLRIDLEEDYDFEEILDEEYMCVVDRHGNQKMIGIPVDSIDEETGEVDVSDGFEFKAGETIEEGDYIVKGQNTTTHSHLPAVCERYLLNYLEWEIDKEDSSLDSVESEKKLVAIDAELSQAFAKADADTDQVDIMDTEYFGVC